MAAILNPKMNFDFRFVFLGPKSCGNDTTLVPVAHNKTFLCFHNPFCKMAAILNSKGNFEWVPILNHSLIPYLTLCTKRPMGLLSVSREAKA